MSEGRRMQADHPRVAVHLAEGGVGLEKVARLPVVDHEAIAAHFEDGAVRRVFARRGLLMAGPPSSGV
jgi:hypothetical protein